jgi:type I restriction enzyme R subunit
MSAKFTESIVEEAALSWFGELGYSVVHGPEIAEGEPAAERSGFGEVIPFPIKNR